MSQFLQRKIAEIEKEWVGLLHKTPKTKVEIERLEIVGKIYSAALNEEIKDLIVELNNKGLPYKDVYDMVNTKNAYPEAIDVLVRHLSKQYHIKNKEGIIRALTVREAKNKANDSLFEEFDKTPKEQHHLRWSIGNAINVVAVPADFNKIVSIVCDKSNGIARQMFVLALGKFKNKHSENILLQLIDDNELTTFAIKALSSLKSIKAKEKIALLANSPNSLIKTEALKALQKYEKNKV